MTADIRFTNRCGAVVRPWCSDCNWAIERPASSTWSGNWRKEEDALVSSRPLNWQHGSRSRRLGGLLYGFVPILGLAQTNDRSSARPRPVRGRFLVSASPSAFAILPSGRCYAPSRSVPAQS